MSILYVRFISTHSVNIEWGVTRVKILPYKLIANRIQYK